MIDCGFLESHRQKTAVLARNDVNRIKASSRAESDPTGWGARSREKGALAHRESIIIKAVKDHSTPRHPGPFKITALGGEFAAIIVAVGFVAMALVSIPIAKFFLLGAVVIGIAIAILFRSLRKKPLFPNRFFSNGH